MKVLSNLWRPYLFVTFSSIIALIVLGEFQWEKIKQDADTELRCPNDVSFTSTRAMLNYQKNLFDTISEEFLSLDLDHDIDRLKATVDRVVKTTQK
ncbi:MAG: hypothetical protein AB9Q22_14680 [Candidatus Reddybacter sp.]